MDERLKQMIEAVCQHSAGSLQWRKAIHRLLIELQQLPGLLKSSHPDYLQALNQTWEKVSRDICKDFEPRTHSLQQSLINWINSYLYWRLKDLHSLKVIHPISLDQPLGKKGNSTSLIEKLSDTGLNTPSLSGIDAYIEQLQQQTIQRLSLKIEDYIKQDPLKKLQNCYPYAYPCCHCQVLSQRRYLKEPPDTFQNIAKTLNMPLIQLTNHWYGRCKPLLQEISKDLGYQPFENL